MAPQRSQSPRDRATCASPTGRYRLVRSDERWTGRSMYFLPPDPQHYRPASAGNTPRARRHLLQANNGPFGAGHGVSFSRRGLDIDTPARSPFPTPSITRHTAAGIPVASSLAPNLLHSGASLPISSSAPSHIASPGTSPTRTHCQVRQQRDIATQSLARKQGESRSEFTDTARGEIDDIRQDVRLHSHIAPVPPGTHSAGARGATTPAPPILVDPATVEAELEDLMKQSVRGLALASSLFLRISHQYISRTVNPPPHATVLFADTVDAYAEFWRAVHPLVRTSRADRQRLYDLTGSPAHLDESETTLVESEDDMDA